MAERTVQLVLHYDGAGFSGWQRQPEQRTVQGVLEAALERSCAPRQSPRWARAGPTPAFTREDRRSAFGCRTDGSVQEVAARVERGATAGRVGRGGDRDAKRVPCALQCGEPAVQLLRRHG